MFERIEASQNDLGRCHGTTPEGGRFTVYDQGAHIAEWVPQEGAEPVLFVSERSRFEPRHAIRGGIPISFPWFAQGRKGNKSPSHGFARVAEWRLVDGQESDGVTSLHWSLDETLIPRLDGVDRYRNRFELTCTQVFGASLQIGLRIRNTDDKPLVVEEALHTYFRVGDVRQTEVRGLGGVEYLDKLSDAYDTQIGPVLFPGEVDRIYWTDAPTEIHDPVLNRRIVVTTHNASNTVVWNPWRATAAALHDLGNDEWQEFVCVESANVRDKALHLNPGQAHELSVTLSVAPL